MPYPAGHRVEMRRKIVDSARSLFNRYGFDNVSISQIMLGAGLTHGGFYNYFDSKNDLYAEVYMGSAEAGPEVVRAYLSRQHYEDVGNSCPMVALPSDVARSGEGAKQAFQTVFAAMVGVLERGLDQDRNSRERAQAIAALCVGGMVVARAMIDRTAADELRDACMRVALQLGGWDRNGKSKDRKRGRARVLSH
jgi:TetR/AcrR family transcriptional regulator, transcriptional repressor for nem operon